MNSLSWLLYAADAVSSFGKVLVVGGFGMFVFGVAQWACRAMERDKWNYPTLNHDQIAGKERPPHFWPTKSLLAAFALFSVSALIPGQQTIYMIAASEMGQRVAQTDDAKEIMGLLKTKVKDLIAEKKL